MSNAKHTPGPWRKSPAGTLVLAGSGLHPVCSLHPQDDFSEVEANARRIAACVNALEGIDDDTLANICMVSGSIAGRFAEQRAHIEAIEQQRDELLAALERTRYCLNVANENGFILDTLWAGDAETLFDFIDAAIAKAREAA